MSPSYGSYSTYPDTYYSKNDQLDSDGPGSVQIPQTDFDPLYSDIANYDSEIDTNFLNISDLGISHSLSTGNELGAPNGTYHMSTSSFMPAMKLNSYVEDLSSEPPVPDDFKDHIHSIDKVVRSQLQVVVRTPIVILSMPGASLIFSLTLMIQTSFLSHHSYLINSSLIFNILNLLLHKYFTVFLSMVTCLHLHLPLRKK